MYTQFYYTLNITHFYAHMANKNIVIICYFLFSLSTLRAWGLAHIRLHILCLPAICCSVCALGVHLGAITPWIRRQRRQNGTPASMMARQPKQFHYSLFKICCLWHEFHINLWVLRKTCHSCYDRAEVNLDYCEVYLPKK